MTTMLLAHLHQAIDSKPDNKYKSFPYKEEVTNSNPVAPTRVFQKSIQKIKTQKKRPISV